MAGPPGRLRRMLLPPGSRRDRFVWLAWLAVSKLRDGPVPWLRAVRLAAYQLLPPRVQDALLVLSGRRPRRLPGDGLRPIAGSAGIAVPGQVTVVLPVYQQAELLAAAVDSVLAQTWPDFELIVVDDGSGPAVAEVLARYRRHPRVRVLRQPNQGLPKALSSAFELARGEFWCWTSADNLMEPTQLERLVGFLQARPAATMVYADYRIIDDRGAPVRGTEFRVADRRGPDDDHVRLGRHTHNLNVIQDNFIGPCFTYRGSAGRLLGDYTPEMGLEDYDYWMRMNRLFRIEHLGVDEPLYRYRVHDDSLSARARELRIGERGRRLMTHDRERGRWFEAPLRLLCDDVTRAATAPHVLEGEELLPQEAPIPDDGRKAVLVVDGARLPALRTEALPATVAVAACCRDVADVYRAGEQLAAAGVLAFGATPALTDRIAVFTRRAFTAAPGPELLTTARCFAADDTFSRRTIAPAAARRAVPEPVAPPLHVLLQVDTFVQGGLEQVVLDLAEGLRATGDRVTLLVLGPVGPAAERARSSGFSVLDHGKKLEPERYGALLAELGVDVVSAHDSPFGAREARRLGRPFVQTIHNCYVWLRGERVEEYRSADADTTAYAAVAAEPLHYADVRLGLDVGKALVLPNGIADRASSADGPLGAAHPLRVKLGLRPDDFVFLQVASVYPPKAQWLAVRALAAVREAGVRAVVLFLGRTMDEHYARTVQAEAERLGVAQAAVFLGHRDDPRPCYALADAFLLPSYWEGCSLAVLEAIAADLPLVLADVGDARRQLRFGRGELVEPPFPAITGLDAGNLGRLLAQPSADHVVRLAAAMTRIAATGSTARRPVSLPFALSRECMTARYRLLFRWLYQGGHPTAVRSLVHRLATDAEAGPGLASPADSAIIPGSDHHRT